MQCVWVARQPVASTFRSIDSSVVGSLFFAMKFSGFSRGLGVEDGEVQLAESHRGAHDPMAEGGYAPAARAGDLRHEAVDVEAVEKPADLSTLLFRVRTKMTGELGAEIAVGEAVDGVLPAHEGD